MEHSYHQQNRRFPSHCRKWRHRRTGPVTPITLQPGQVAFRVVCHHSIVGGLIGFSGCSISEIQRDTGCVIRCEELVEGSEHRVIQIVGSGYPERRISLESGLGDDAQGKELVSAAQDAVVRVFERMWQVDSENGGFDDCASGVREGYYGLLADTTQIGPVMGIGGRNIARMRRESGAQITTLPAPFCAVKDDGLIQITGAILAVKKALVAVTACLRDCSPFDKDSMLLARPVNRDPHGIHSDHLAEFFPHLSLMLPPLTGNSVNALSSQTDNDRDPNEETKSTHQEVSFRLLCSNGAAGSIIGNRGTIVRALQKETGAAITFAAPITKSGERVVTIWAWENVESFYSPAQDAVVLVFARSIEHDIAKGHLSVLIKGAIVTARLLVAADEVCCLSGNGGRMDPEIIEAIGADIKILEGDQVQDCASEDDVVVQITGEYKNVQTALFQVTGKLRGNLLPSEVLEEVRERSPDGRVREVTSRFQQSEGRSLDSAQDASLERGVNQLGLYQNLDPMFDKDPILFARPVNRAPHGVLSDHLAQFFPQLSLMLPPLTGDPVNVLSLRTDADRDPNEDTKSTHQEVSFRLLCSNGAAGSIIGKQGTIVRALQKETGAAITFAAPITESGERVVTISAWENVESFYSPAQDAVVLVFARSIEHDIAKGHLSVLIKGAIVTARLLVAADEVCCLSGNGGKMDPEIIEAIGADIKILEGDQVQDCASEDDVVVQITGEYKNVQTALFQVTGKLRSNLLPREVLEEVRERSPDGGVREVTSRFPQSAGRSLDSAQDASLNLGRERTTTITNNKSSSTTVCRGSVLEKSLDFHLPREVLNDVGKRSYGKGLSKVGCHGSHLSLGRSPDSILESVLAPGNDQFGLSNNIGGPSLGLQPPQSLERGCKIAIKDGGRGSTTSGGSVELGRKKKSAIVANTSVELLVSEDIIRSVYGEDGSNLARLQQVSGAKVEVRDPSSGKSEGMVVISGKPDQTMAAQCLLQALIFGS